MKQPFILLLGLFLLSCAGDNAQLEECQLENKVLKHEKSELDSTFNNVTRVYSELDSTSKVIAAKKDQINQIAKKGKLSKKDKENILAEMDTINQLLESNRNKVTDLQGTINGGGLEEGFRFMVQSMDEKNTSEDLLLNDMKSDLARMSKDFSELFEDYVYKEAENLEMQEKLTTAAKELVDAQQKLDMAKEKLKSGWYVLGTQEELRKRKLVYKGSLFESDAVNEDFDKSQFKKIDIFELKEIILDAKKAEIKTTHPSEAYEMVGIKKQVNKLVITNPELFWSVSKFLIIELEK